MIVKSKDGPENGRSNEVAKSLERYGGAEGDRTLGLLTASQALSQLSYSPTVIYITAFP
jgi:hypothetical protein